MMTMKWQTTIPTRAQIEAHRANGGAWLVLVPTTSPFGGAATWSVVTLATFVDEDDDAVAMLSVSIPKRHATEGTLGTAQESDDGDPRKAWRFAPVKMNEADYTFQPWPCEVSP